MQQGVQTDATCNIQQYWELLAKPFAFVCTGLNGEEHESTKGLIDEIIYRLNTTQEVKVEEDFDDALDGVFPSMIELVYITSNTPFHLQDEYYRKVKKIVDTFYNKIISKAPLSFDFGAFFLCRSDQLIIFYSR